MTDTFSDETKEMISASQGKPVDFDCYQLAAHFLEDEPCRNDPALFEKHCESLARWIMESVEEWFVTPDDPAE